ncbi:TAFII55 protein, conserved region [Trema orientale]|uniref:TAFII55 protein, conserved region n=1 Tax=Trema orientale TaxID=63057 RepID=A0A2P5EDJ0_TREOI|nr:TAFII55 protein, conserved region [Trema orientale]
MEEQFILRVPPSVAERIERLLNEDASSSEDKSLDVSFLEDGRTGTFVIGNESFPASLLDLPSVVESYKTYDDSVLIKTADIGQMIMVREPGDAAPDAVEYRHGLTPPMRDARKRRFRREPDLNPELVRRVEEDLLNISAGGPAETVDILIFGVYVIHLCLMYSVHHFHKHRVSKAENVKGMLGLHVEVAEQEKSGDANARNANKQPAPAPVAQPDVPEAGANAGEPDRSDSDESDDSV